jgi:protein-disulfide isomerase
MHTRLGWTSRGFDREMANSTYSDRIMKDYYNNIIYGISGTPTTFINGTLYAMGGTQLLGTVKDDPERPNYSLDPFVELSSRCFVAS